MCGNILIWTLLLACSISTRVLKHPSSMIVYIFKPHQSMNYKEQGYVYTVYVTLECVVI